MTKYAVNVISSDRKSGLATVEPIEADSQEQALELFLEANYTSLEELASMGMTNVEIRSLG